MTKSVIVKVFFGSLIGLAGGLVLLLIAGGLALGNDIFLMRGPDVVGVRSGALSWGLLGMVGLAVLVMICAAAAQFVAWVGAVLNTANLPSKNWFAALLVVGLLGFVFLATLAYVLAGPDGMAAREQTRASAELPYQSGVAQGTGPLDRDHRSEAPLGPGTSVR